VISCPRAFIQNTLTQVPSGKHTHRFTSPSRAVILHYRNCISIWSWGFFLNIFYFCHGFMKTLVYFHYLILHGDMIPSVSNTFLWPFGQLVLLADKKISGKWKYWLKDQCPCLSMSVPLVLSVTYCICIY
jgi:hypothetical protein